MLSALRDYVLRGFPQGQAEALAELDALEQRAAHTFRVRITHRLLRAAHRDHLLDIGARAFARELDDVLQRLAEEQREAQVAAMREQEQRGPQGSHVIAHERVSPSGMPDASCRYDAEAGREVVLPLPRPIPIHTPATEPRRALDGEQPRAARIGDA